MSSCQSSPEATKRSEEFKKEFKADLLTRILPKMLLQEDFTSFIDVAYGIDKRALVVESLREVAALIETKYSIEDIKKGCDDD